MNNTSNLLHQIKVGHSLTTEIDMDLCGNSKSFHKVFSSKVLIKVDLFNPHDIKYISC